MTEDSNNNTQKGALQRKEEVLTEQLSAKAISLIGKEIDGKYKILEVIGSGGMGVVYKGEQTFLDRLVAIKFLHTHLIQDETYLSRFRREAKAASRLNHPNAALLYDFGTFQGIPYLVMELVQGKTLKEKLEKEGAQSFRYVQEIILQTTSALKEAHQNGIVHRDLKPDNLMISKGPGGHDFIKVLDFGIAKLLPQAGDETQTIKTQVGTLIGTPRYASPEQVLGKPLDQRTDIYSLGIIIYETLSGEVPFDAPSMIECLFKHVNEEPKPLTVWKPELYIPKEFDSLVLKCLAKQPEDRFQNVDELIEALKRVQVDVKTNRKDFPSESKLKKGSSNAIWWLLFVFVALVLVCLFTWHVLSRTVDKEEEALPLAVTENIVASIQSSSVSEEATSLSSSVSSETITIEEVQEVSSTQQEQSSSSTPELTNQDAETMLREGELDYRNKNYTEAIKKFEKGLGVITNHKKALLSYGICLQRLGRYEEALLQFEKALEQDQTWPPTYFNLSCYYAVRGESDKALENLKKAVNLDNRVRGWAKNEPDLNSLRDDPRFKKIVGK